MAWSDKAWRRHLELSELSGCSMSEEDWYIHFLPGKVIFLNYRTAQEFEQPITERQRRDLLYGDTLLCCTSFIQWPEGMKPKHYGRNCR